MAATFRDAVREALVATGRRVLLDPRAFVGAVTDLYDPLSAEVWVLRANCSAEMLQPLAEAASGRDPARYEAAARSADSYLRDRCRVAPADASKVAWGVALGAADAMGVATGSLEEAEENSRLQRKERDRLESTERARRDRDRLEREKHKANEKTRLQRDAEDQEAYREVPDGVGTNGAKTTKKTAWTSLLGRIVIGCVVFGIAFVIGRHFIATGYTSDKPSASVETSIVSRTEDDSPVVSDKSDEEQDVGNVDNSQENSHVADQAGDDAAPAVDSTNVQSTTENTSTEDTSSSSEDSHSYNVNDIIADQIPDYDRTTGYSSSLSYVLDATGGTKYCVFGGTVHVYHDNLSDVNVVSVSLDEPLQFNNQLLSEIEVSNSNKYTYDGYYRLDGYTLIFANSVFNFPNMTSEGDNVHGVDAIAEYPYVVKDNVLAPSVPDEDLIRVWYCNLPSKLI